MFSSRHQKKLSFKCQNDEARFPIEILNLWDLTELEIIGGNFTYFPEDISILKRLTKLSLVSTKISLLPKEIFELPQLTYLNLKNNRLSSLPLLRVKSSLKEMILGRNYLPASALSSFLLYFSELSSLDLGHNNLEEIPEGLLSLKNLSRLNLENNRLHGLPLELKELKSLTHLSVNDNPFPHEEKKKIEKYFNIIF